ncbi:MAG TPA: SDR family oxidoreductase [Mycobacteriales bacterium]|nr:SDR family oxidoreductase [Mycobacteriales bacterium]
MLSRKRHGPPGVAVVTGGTAGIGRAVVRELAARGWDVAVLARGRDRIDDTVREVRDAGRRSVGISVDVADAAAVDRAADEVEDALGPIDVWVNNAFTGAISFFDEITPEEFERITAVTYFGYVNGTRAALHRMTPRNRGTIIQVGSALAHRGIPLQSPYCGAKHAIKGFTESVRVEVMHKGIAVDVCIVDMPAVNTPQFDWVLHRGIDHHPMPVPPIYQPEVAGRAVAHVAEHPRRTMWVGLPTALTVLGNRVAPALLDRFLARTNVEGQQSPDHDPPADRSNTWEPVYGAEVQARGSFDDKAHARSPELWVTRHRALVGASLAGGAGLLARRLLR